MPFLASANFMGLRQLIARLPPHADSTEPHLSTIPGGSCGVLPRNLQAPAMQSDGIQLLAERLQALQEDGLKVNPATANPGALLVSGVTNACFHAPHRLGG